MDTRSFANGNGPQPATDDERWRTGQQMPPPVQANWLDEIAGAM